VLSDTHYRYSPYVSVNSSVAEPHSSRQCLATRLWQQVPHGWAGNCKVALSISHRRVHTIINLQRAAQGQHVVPVPTRPVRILPTSSLYATIPAKFVPFPIPSPHPQIIHCAVQILGNVWTVTDSKISTVKYVLVPSAVRGTSTTSVPITVELPQLLTLPPSTSCGSIAIWLPLPCKLSTK